MPYKCRVCSRFIRGVYTHYGGQACSACGAFFIRAINKGRKYVCGNQNLCLAIPSRVGIKCGKCRFKKCLEIGMHSSTAFQNNKNNNNGENGENSEATKEFGKYLILAKELYGMFMVITKDPKQLLHYFNRESESCNLNEEASKLAKTLEPISSIQKWAKIFQNNEISFNEIYLLFYAIICCIKFPWLPIEDQQIISAIQHQAIYQFLQPSAYSAPEIKEVFDKLTVFFQKQYTKHFSLKKLQENGQFNQLFSDVLSLDS